MLLEILKRLCFFAELDVIASSETLASPLDMSPSEEPSPKRSKYSYPVNSMETMQRSVMNAFALKYSKYHICIPHV